MSSKEWRQFIWWAIRHPLHLLAGLYFFAFLEAAFGSPTGAKRLLIMLLVGIELAVFVLVIAAGVWLSAAGYGVHLWLVIGTAVMIGFLRRHLRWR